MTFSGGGVGAAQRKISKGTQWKKGGNEIKKHFEDVLCGRFLTSVGGSDRCPKLRAFDIWYMEFLLCLSFQPFRPFLPAPPSRRSRPSFEPH